MEDNSKGNNQKENNPKDNSTKSSPEPDKTESSEKSSSQSSGENALGANTSSAPRFNTKHKERQVSPPTEPRKSNISLDEEAPEPASPNSTTVPSSQSSSLNEALSSESESQPEAPKPGTVHHSSASQQSAQGSSNSAEQSGQPATPQGPGGPVQQASPNESDGGAKQNSSKGKKKQIVAGALVLLLAVLGFGGYAAYAQYVAPRQAPASYLQRLSAAESGEYEMSFASDSDEINLDVDSKGDFSQEGGGFENLKLSSELELALGQGFMSFNLKMDMLYLEDMLYVKSDDTESIPMFGPMLESGAWYSMDLEESGTMSLSDKCTDEDKQALADYMEGDVSKAINVTNPKRHDWFGEERGGEKVKHYSGSIPKDTFLQITRDAAEMTSDECVSDEDVKEAEEEAEEASDVDYDLYVGSDHDELVVRWTEDGEEVGKLTMKTGKYGKEVDITAPEDSEPLDEVLQGGFGMSNTPAGASGSFESSGSSDFGTPQQPSQGESDFEFDTR